MSIRPFKGVLLAIIATCLFIAPYARASEYPAQTKEALEAILSTVDHFLQETDRLQSASDEETFLLQSTIHKLLCIGQQHFLVSDSLAALALERVCRYAYLTHTHIGGWLWNVDMLEQLHQGLITFVSNPDNSFIKEEIPSTSCFPDPHAETIPFIINWFNLLKLILDYSSFPPEENVREILERIVATYCTWSGTSMAAWRPHFFAHATEDNTLIDLIPEEQNLDQEEALLTEAIGANGCTDAVSEDYFNEDGN